MFQPPNATGLTPTPNSLKMKQAEEPQPAESEPAAEEPAPDTRLSESLEKSLKEQGWQASTEEDGSVTYRQPAKSAQ